MKAYISILQALGVADVEFVSIAVDEEKGFKQYQEIIKDCSETEKRLLLNSLENLKVNMKILMREIAS